jgi:hypothetical protein
MQMYKTNLVYQQKHKKKSSQNLRGVFVLTHEKHNL